MGVVGVVWQISVLQPWSLEHISNDYKMSHHLESEMHRNRQFPNMYAWYVLHSDAQTR